MRAKKWLCLGMGMLLLLSGCSGEKPAEQQTSGEETGTNEDGTDNNTGETVYYSYQETVLPDIEEALPDIEEGYTWWRYDIRTEEGKVFRLIREIRSGTVYDIKSAYIQETDWEGDISSDWQLKEIPTDMPLWAADIREANDGSTEWPDIESYDADAAKKWNDAEGNCYIYEEGAFSYTVLDKDFSRADKKELNGRVYGFLQGKAGEPVYWYGLGTNNKLCVRNTETGEALLENQEIASLFRADMTEDGTLYVADNNAIYVYDGEFTELYSLKEDYPFGALYGMSVSDNGDIRLLAEMDEDMVVMNFQKLDTPVTLTKEEITIGFLNNHVALQKSVARFNRQSDKYRIVLDYEKEVNGSYKPYWDDMKLSVSTGGGPDIIGSDMIEDIEPYVKNGYLECLDDLLPTQGEYENAAFESSRVNGKMYGIPYEYYLSLVIYNRDAVGDKQSITVEELMDAVEKSDAKILEPGLSGEHMVYYYALFDDTNTAYIDWEKGESHLTEQPFLDMLAFAKKYEDTGVYGDNERELLQSGTAFAKCIRVMEDFTFWDEAYSQFNGNPAILGYPRSNGNGYYITANELYLNVNSTHKEGAKEFMRFLLTEEEQVRYAKYDTLQEMQRLGSSSVFGYKCRFPVSMKALDVIVEKKIEEDKTLVRMDENGNVYGKPPFDEAQIERFYYVVQNANPGNANIVPLLSVVWDELNPYFNGECSAEEAAAKLDNRVQLYLDER